MTYVDDDADERELQEEALELCEQLIGLVERAEDVRALRMSKNPNGPGLGRSVREVLGWIVDDLEKLDEMLHGEAIYR